MIDHDVFNYPPPPSPCEPHVINGRALRRCTRFQSLKIYKIVDSFCYIECPYGNLCLSMGVYGCLRESMDKYKYVSVYECYGRLCVSMGIYESLWWFFRVYRIVWVCGWLWVLWNSMGVYMCSCASMGVYGRIRSLWESRWIWIVGGFIYAWYVGGMYMFIYMFMFIVIWEFVRVYGSLWGAMGMGPKHPWNT